MQANQPDIYLSSVNGLAKSGGIINIDGNRNRVALIFYGHEKVYLIIGKNKLAGNYQQAVDWAHSIAASINARRLQIKTPCAINADRCYDCQSPERICQGLSVLWMAPLTSEIEIILFNQDLGY